jgi:hypothetical protein
MRKRLRGRVRRRRLIQGADKGYDTQDFLQACEELRATPHVARRQSYWGSAPGPAGDHPGLPGKPAEAQAGGGDLRLDQDG